MAKAGGYLSREYVRMKISAVQEREKIAPECLQRVKNCLRRIVEYAAAKNIRIGLEARRDYEQIPTERELANLLDEMNSPNLGYWHDFGHCADQREPGVPRSRRVAARSRSTCVWLPRARLHLACARSSTAFYRRGRL